MSRRNPVGYNTFCRVVFLFFVAILLPGLHCGCMAGEKPTLNIAAQLDLGDVISERMPRLVINVLPINIETPTDMTPDRLDALIKSGTLSCKCVVDFPPVVKRICRELEKVQFYPSKQQGIDLRYRFDFMNGATVVQSIYADKFGKVLVKGKIYETRDGNEWIGKLFRSISQELYFEKK